MSLRLASRRGAAGAAVAAELPDAQSVSVADIRVRKWTKQLKTVGHLTILKWVPDQENPTLALQKGAPKKTKGGRKRAQTGEVGRMTRSVRQHLDAPLELLNEFPMARNNQLKPLPATTTVAPTPTLLEASADFALSAQPSTVESGKGGEQRPQTAEATAPAVATAPSVLSGSHGNDPLLASAVQSDEQLEMALDDLPMLDSDEDLPFDSLLEDQVPAVSPAGGALQANEAAAASTSEPSATAMGTGKRQPVSAATAVDVAAPELSPVSAAESTENTAESTAEGDDDDASNSSSGSDDDDDDGNGSAISGSPMPSPSPQTSPMLSRSPSP